MNLPKITIRIEDREYCLDATDGPAILEIPQADRKHLITLFSAIQKQEANMLREKSAMEIASRTESEEAINIQALPKVAFVDGKPKKEEIDQLMEGLIAKEKSLGRSWKFSKGQWYLILGGLSFFVSAILLALI